jgi:hypothetical protein
LIVNVFIFVGEIIFFGTGTGTGTGGGNTTSIYWPCKLGDGYKGSNKVDQPGEYRIAVYDAYGREMLYH